MPLARIDLRRGKPPAYRKAICDGVYRALREIFNVPENDRFLVVNEHDADNFVHADTYLGVAYSEDFVIMQITVSDTRNTATKQALYARIVALLAENPGLRKEDIFINLVECKTENWSFGNGVAQYVATAT
jgi:4-oxalocrotonate tautomerase